MNSERLDLGFIQRCLEPEFQKQAIDWTKFGNWKKNKWSRDNPQKHNDVVK